MKIGNNVFIFDKLTSTQDWVRKQYLSNCIAEGAVCVARTQSSGRGRFSRRWSSNSGGLYLSFGCNWQKEKAYQLGFYIPVALILFLKGVSVDASIKWPNDVFVGSSKLAGILIEPIDEGAYACGIGINVFNDISGIDRNVVRLADLTDAFTNIHQVMFLVISALNRVFGMNFSQVFSDYKRFLWAVPGKWRCVIDGEEQELEVVDVLETGRLKTNMGDFDYLDVRSIDGQDIL